MKVRCTKLLDPLGNPQDKSAWLTIGRIYHVLSIVLDVHGRWLLRLQGDTAPGVGLFPLQQFEVVSAKVPDLWIVTWSGQGAFELTTAAWNDPGFWERYFEHDFAAEQIFERDKSRIIRFDP